MSVFWGEEECIQAIFHLFKSNIKIYQEEGTLIYLNYYNDPKFIMSIDYRQNTNEIGTYIIITTVFG